MDVVDAFLSQQNSLKVLLTLLILLNWLTEVVLFGLVCCGSRTIIILPALSKIFRTGLRKL